MTISRRDFVLSSTTATAWIALAAACREGQETASDQPGHAPSPEVPPPPATLAHFTPAQAREVEAIAARIIPADDTPGAREAGVVWFIDRALTTFGSNDKKLFADGLVDLGRRVGRAHRGVSSFASLSADQQDALLRQIDRTPFFGAVRFGTIAGMFAHPRHGGNRDYAGWKLLEREPVFEYSPPFGWYDRPENQQALIGEVL
ncbi:MAG: gluconate 2-dehydrogenase subunit 3 family protein [Gemmatimonadota bacterium]